MFAPVVCPVTQRVSQAAYGVSSTCSSLQYVSAVNPISKLGSLGELQRDSDSESDSSSLADSAFVYKAQAQQANSRHSRSNSFGDFDRASQRIEKGLGLGSSENESLLSYDPRRVRGRIAPGCLEDACRGSCILFSTRKYPFAIL